MLGNVAAQKSHDEFTVGVHHIEMNIQRLADGAHTGQSHIPVPQKNKLRGFQIMHAFALVLLPALALWRVDMNGVTPALQLLI